MLVLLHKWDSAMLTDLDDFYCFAQVVEHGGFSAAERTTDIPKSKLSRRV